MSQRDLGGQCRRQRSGAGSLSNQVPVLDSPASLLSALGADGIDLDPEPMFYTYGQFASPTVLLTEWAQQTLGLLATWVPYMAQPSWQATAQLLAQDSGTIPPTWFPSWINVQPGWSTGDDLSGWAQSLGVGIGSIVAGFNVGDPQEIQNTLAGLVSAAFLLPMTL